MSQFVFVVYMLVNGQLQPNTHMMNVNSRECVMEQQVLGALNRANARMGVDVRYLGECRIR